MRWPVWLLLPLAVLGLSEVLLRLADPAGLQYYRRSKLIHAYHPEYTIALRPSSRQYLKHTSGLWEGWFTMNSLGMRDTEEPRPGAGKILCLGDSLSMGFGVGDEDAMCHLLKAPAAEQGLQVLNASVDGFGSLAYRVRAQEVASQVDGLQTLLLFPSPTDWWIPDAFRERGILPDDEKDARRTDDPFYRNVFRLQFEATGAFYTLQALKLAQEQLQLQATMLRNDVTAWVHGVIGRSAGENVLAARDGFADAFEPTKRPEKKVEAAVTCPEPLPAALQCMDDEPDPGPMPEFTVRQLEALIAFCKERGIRLVVVRLPMQEEEIRCRSIGKHHAHEAYAIQGRRFFEEHHIDVIDLMPHTRSMCALPDTSHPHGLRIGDHYLPGDGHLTPTGNRWAAASLTEELRRIGVLNARMTAYPDVRAKPGGAEK